MARLLLLLGIALMLYQGWHWFLRTPPERVASLLRKVLPVLLIVVLLILAATGRLNWLFALVAALIPALQRLSRVLWALPQLHDLWRSFGRHGEGLGGASRMRTASLELRIDPVSGRMDGQVLQGPHAGRALSELTLDQLRGLLAHFRQHDPSSVPLLVAYLDRTQGPGWRNDGSEATGEATGQGPMTREQAYQILGLEPGADRDQIVAAHRRLMQRLHPDRGGSTWLASQVNRAKDLLLEG